MPEHHKQMMINLIAGFNGAGKTTLIKRLVESRPVDERWAVIAIESSGLDIERQQLAQQGVRVMFVDGGEPDAIARMKLQMALTELTASRRYHRVLVELAGHSNPADTLRWIHSRYFGERLDVMATITVIDANVLVQPAFRKLKLLNWQLENSDAIVVNKTDIIKDDALVRLNRLLDAQALGKRKIYHSLRGDVSSDILSIRPAAVRLVRELNGDIESRPRNARYAAHWTVEERQYNGLSIGGWQFDDQVRFDYARLKKVLNGLDAYRYKGVANTERGSYHFDLQDGFLSIAPCEPMAGSVFEVIDTDLDIGDCSAMWRSAM